jgi:ribonuclease P protein component
MSTTPLRFPRCAHLRASAEFQAVFGEGKRVSGASFRLHVLLKADTTQTRLGVTVSKRVDKAAVRRNRLRRQIKEAFRLQRATLPAGDYVVLAKPEAGKLDNTGVRAELLGLFERAKRLPAATLDVTNDTSALNPPTPPALNDPTSTGTMPASDARVRRDATDH